MMNQRGFTLLEAIVALVLIATTGMALLDWINTNLITLQHVQQAQQRNEATRNALAFMETVNPLENPQGEETIGMYTISWDAQEIELKGDTKLYQIGLYETKVKISLKDTLLAKFNLHQIGFKQYFQSEF